MGAKKLNSEMCPILILILLFLFISNSAIAKTQTFIKEYTYQASEADSKLSSRSIALEQVKRLLLEELGTYLESYTEIAEFRLKKDQITALTAGIVQTQVLKEAWDGEKYWLRAKIEADPNEVYKAIDLLRKDLQKMRELEETRKKVEELSLEIARLKNEIKTDGKNQGKIAQYTKAVEGLNAVVIFQNVLKLSIAGKLQEAIDELSNSIKKTSGYALAYAIRGHLYTRLGKNELAIRDSNRAIELDPKLALAYASRAYIYYRLGDREKVLEDSNRAIELDPGFTYAYLLRSGSFYRLKSYKKALENAEKAVELSPNNALAYSARGAIHEVLGNKAQAVADIKKAMELDPNCAEILIAQAEVQTNSSKYEDGLHSVNRAIELDPYLSASYAHRCFTYTKMENYDQALADCNKAIELAPRSNTPYAYRGAVYHYLGKDNKAIEDWKIAARLGNDTIQKVLKNKGVAW